MITPTVARMVHVYKRVPTPQPEAAIITYVHNDTLINVAGFDANGNQFALTGLYLCPDNMEPPHSVHAEWMPFQKGQAAKTEQLEKQLTSNSGPVDTAIGHGG